MSEFELSESFDIDDGELDGLRPQDCFVLGYELCQFHALADKGGAFSKLAHADNTERIGDALLRRGLEFTVGLHDETWVTFNVEAMS